MSTSKTFHCIVDDTALITNINEIEPWVQKGLVALVVPLHTLERLHLLKKDTSQIGQNARRAVKFLDQITSKDDLPHDPVVIQGPEDQYTTWQEVEHHYNEPQVGEIGLGIPRAADQDTEGQEQDGKVGHRDESTMLPHMLSNKLHLGNDEKAASPLSTPPLSPSSSGPVSSKTTPETKIDVQNGCEKSPVPPTLKGLINPVVWYTYQKKGKAAETEMIFLTNSADTAQIARDFGVVSKTIHQLREAIGVEEQETKNQKKRSSHANSPKANAEPKTLFSYDEGSSDEEEVVFQPRPRGSSRPQSSGRGGPPGSNRPRRTPKHSPSNSMSSPPVPKPQIPTEEIDPDSFDRGGFARGSIPLANVGTPNMNHGRGNHRGQSAPSGPRGNGGGMVRGNHHYQQQQQQQQQPLQQRGGNVGRGRGRLFVP